MKKETRKKVNILLKKATGNPSKNDLGTCVVKDLKDCLKINKELTAKIAINEYNKWKKS